MDISTIGFTYFVIFFFGQFVHFDRYPNACLVGYKNVKKNIGILQNPTHLELSDEKTKKRNANSSEATFLLLFLYVGNCSRLFKLQSTYISIHTDF